MARKRRIEREDAVYHVMNRVEEMNHHEEREEHEGRVLRGFGVGFLGPGLMFYVTQLKDGMKRYVL